MKSCWLTQEKNSSCILFLSGWSMDSIPFQVIPVISHDLLMVYDYRQIEPAPIIKLIEKYDSLYLVAWSMGVWIAGKFLSEYKDLFTSSIAINGTLTPIDDQFGIPVKAFDTMINDFSPAVLDEFYQDMFNQQDQVQQFFNNRPDRSPESILSELQTLRHLYSEHGPGEDIFDRKIVGSRDKIFPARSQLRCWGKENCERIQAAHFPFYDWSSWDLITGTGFQDS